MNNKTLYALLIAVILTLSMGGCKKSPADKAEERLKELTSKMKTPIKVNEVTTLTECYYKDKTLTYRNETTHEVLTAINADSLRNTTLGNLKSNLFSQKLIDNVIKADANIRYIYFSDSDSIMFTFTPNDLRKE